MMRKEVIEIMVEGLASRKYPKSIGEAVSLMYDDIQKIKMRMDIRD